LNAVAVALLAAVLLAGGAYALMPGFERLLGSDPGAQQVALADLGRQVDLAHTSDGFTVALQWVYADANRVIIGHRVTGPPGRNFIRIDAMLSRTPPTLTDTGGRALPLKGGVAPAASERFAQELAWFDAGAITEQPAELALRLTIPELRAVEQVDPQSPARQFTVPGPFTFEFTVPFVPARVAEVNQTVVANGTAMTLERVVVTPSEARLFLRGAAFARAGAPPQGRPNVKLLVDGENVYRPKDQYGPGDLEGAGHLEEPQGERAIVHFPVSLIDRPGERVVEVWPRLVRDAPGPGTPIAAHEYGDDPPWTFRFSGP
jgi:hypothetical protein